MNSAKYLLVISKNYWGANKAEETAVKFEETFKRIVKIPDENTSRLIGSEVTLAKTKEMIKNKVTGIKDGNRNSILYIYMNGHGNQVYDSNGDERVAILEGETYKDASDEVYQLPDGNLVDDELTTIINDANTDNPNKLLIVLISDHCSSGSMLDNNISLNYDFITYGSSYDNEDSYMTGDGNVMTINFLSLLNKKCENIHEYTAMSFFRLLDTEMKESFIGDMQKATIHVSDAKMFLQQLF